MPETHVSPEGQTWPQAPQLLPSVCVFTSQPSSGLVLQSAKPMEHALMAHALAMHDDVALGRLHATPHAPQLVALDVVSVSQPLAAMPSQLPKCGLHATTAHIPAAQPLIDVLAPLQTVPQAPQLVGSMAVLAQYCEVPV